MSWSQTPSAVWLALDASTSTISLDSMLNTPSPNRERQTREKRETAALFYQNVDEVDLGETEEDIKKWIKEDTSHGAIR